MRVLHLIDHSVPHHSGYSFRSRYIVQIQRRLGIDARVGSLEVGKNATLFVADGDPFELTTTITRAYIDGRQIDLGDKQTALRDKYREKYRQLGITE